MVADKIKDEMMEKVQGGADTDTGNKRDLEKNNTLVMDDGEMKGVAKKKTGNLLKK